MVLRGETRANSATAGDKIANMLAVDERMATYWVIFHLEPMLVFFFFFFFKAMIALAFQRYLYAFFFFAGGDWKITRC